MKTNKKRGAATTTVTDLSQLGKAMETAKLAIPKLNSIPTLEGLGDSVQGKLDAVAKIETDVASAMKYRFDATRRLAGCKTKLEKRIVLSEVEGPMKDMDDYIGSVLGMKDVVLKARAASAYLNAMFSQSYESNEEAMKALDAMAERGLLVKDGKGQIVLGYQHYSVSPAFGLDDDDLAGLAQVIQTFSNALKQLENQRREEVKVTMTAQAEISLEDVRAGKNGLCMIEVPAQRYKEGDEWKWRGGGFLLANFQDEEVVPVMASGSIESMVRNMTEIEVVLQRRTLGYNQPPGWNKGSFDAFVGALEHKLGLSEAEAGVYVRKAQGLWWLIQRGVELRNQLNKTAASRTEMAAKATITSAQFFGLNGSSNNPVIGQPALLEYKGAWRQDKGDNIYGMFFLAVRTKEGEEGFFNLTEVPPHLKELFGHMVGKRFPINEKYAGWPGQLAQVVRAMFGQAEMEVAVAASPADGDAK